MRPNMIVSPRILAASLFLLSACGGDDDNDGGEVDMGRSDADMVPDAGLDTGPDMDASPMPDVDTGDDGGGDDADDDMGMDMGPIPDGPEVTPASFALFAPVPAQCDSPSRRYRLPFGLLVRDADGNVRPIAPYDRIGGRPVIPNETINTGILAPERVRLSQEGGGECVRNADCEAGFRCGVGGNRDAARVCVSNIDIALVPNSVRVDYEPARGPNAQKGQIVTSLIENTGGMRGILPTEVGGRFGEDGSKDLLADGTRGTDSTLIQRELLRQLFFPALASFIDPATSLVSAWWFGGSSRTETQPLTRIGLGRDPNHYTADLDEPANNIAQMPEPGGQQGYSNLYQSIDYVIEKDLGLEMYDGYEKILYLFVDGPNEVYDPTIDLESITEKLIDEGVHVFIVHFDSARDASRLRDPLAYWAGNLGCRNDDSCGADPCADDSECAGYESCRPAIVYGESADDAPTTTPLSYCMPRYREDGRTGPIGEFSELACRTGGNYLYFDDVSAMNSTLQILPVLLDGGWSIEADIAALDIERAAAGFYRLSGTFLALFGNSSLAQEFSANKYEPICVAGLNRSTSQSIMSLASDAGLPDGGLPDGGIDGGLPDGGVPDGGAPDGGAPDGGLPDGGIDGGAPDGGAPDGGVPDGGVDGGLPDGGLPDGGIDGGVPDGGLPDAGFDGGMPDSGPDGGMPDGGTPDTGPPIPSECPLQEYDNRPVLRLGTVN